MKIIINKTGKTEEVSEKVASRLINKGKAHIPEEIPFNDFVPNKEEQKIIEEYSKKQEWPIRKPKRSRKKKANGKNQHNNSRKRRSELF